MKFSAAAVVFALSAAAQSSSTVAFVPHHVQAQGGSRQVGDRRSNPTTKKPFLERPSFLRTTEENVELLASVIRESLRSSSSTSPSSYSSSLTKEELAVDEQLAEVDAIEVRTKAAQYISQYVGESGASIVYSKLIENGVEVVNGFSGGANLPLLDQFHPDHPRHAREKRQPIRWITNSNESSAGHVAEGYAKSMPIDGEHKPVSVVVATSGPGVTNLITPMQDAICDGVPVIFLCGQAATTAPEDAFQSAPAVDLTRPCTKWSYQIKSAAEVPMVMDYAFYLARNGRPGPIFIDLPKDLLGQALDSELVDSFVNTNLLTAEDDSAFVRLQKRYRPTGEVFQALQIGESQKSLPFEIVKSGGAGFKMRPAPTASTTDFFLADHQASNKIIKREYAVNGVDSDRVVEDALESDGTLTTEIINLVRLARKPVILAGQGCNDSPQELTAFAEKFQIPVTTTLHGMGCFDERHPLALNMLGMHGHATPNYMVQDADLIICIGSRFDDRITGRQCDFIPEARRASEEGRGGVVHVDIRMTENAKQIKPNFFVHSTANRFLRTMNKAAEKMDIKPHTGPWLEKMKESQIKYPIHIPRFPTQEINGKDAEGNEITLNRTPMSVQFVIQELNRQLVDSGMIDEAIFSTGVGVHQMVAAQLITWTQPRQMLSSGSLGTMGVGLGYCIGSKLANKNKLCIAVDGDGSFNMTFTELKTLREQKIPVKIMVVDNDGQMMVEYWQHLFHSGRIIAVRNKNPDYASLATAFGVKGIRCDCEEELEEKMRQFLFDDPDEPVVFHVPVRRTPCLPLVSPGLPLDAMILEDGTVDVDGMAAPS